MFHEPRIGTYTVFDSSDIRAHCRLIHDKEFCALHGCRAEFDEISGGKSKPRRRGPDRPLTIANASHVEAWRRHASRDAEGALWSAPRRKLSAPVNSRALRHEASTTSTSPGASTRSRCRRPSGPGKTRQALVPDPGPHRWPPCLHKPSRAGDESLGGLLQAVRNGRFRRAFDGNSRCLGVAPGVRHLSGDLQAERRGHRTTAARHGGRPRLRRVPGVRAQHQAGRRLGHAYSRLPLGPG